MAVAGTLEIQMMASIARLESDMKQVKNTVNGTMSSVEKSVGAAKSALASLGLTLGAGAFVALIKGSIDAADHLNDLSKSTALTVEQLSGLRIAAKQSGSDLDGIAASITKLSQNMGKDAEKFAALGVSAKDPLEALEQLADIFVAIEDPQLRAAVGAAALGKSWASAAPLLAEGGKAIAEMVEKGSAATGMTTEFAKQSDALNDKLVILTSTGGLLTRTVAPLLPLLNELAEQMVSAQKATTSTAGEFSPLLEAFKAAIVLGGNVAFVFRQIGMSAGGTAAQLAALATADFSGFATIRKELAADLENGRKELDKWERSIMAVGTTADVAAAKLDGMDQVSRRMASDAAAAAREASASASAKAKVFVGGEDKEAKAMETAYKSLIRTITEKNAAMRLEVAGIAKQTEAEKILHDTILKLTDGTLKLTAAQKNALAVGLEAMFALEAEVQLLAQRKAGLEALTVTLQAGVDLEQEVLDIMAQREDKTTQAVLSAEKMIEQIQFETSVLTMSNDEREKAIALHSLEISGLDKESDAYKQLAIRIKAALDAKSGVQAAVDAQKRAAQDMADAWKRAGSDIEGSLTRAFGSSGAAIGGMVKAYADGVAAQVEIDERYRKAREINGADLVVLAQKQQDETAQNALKSYGDMASAAASFFDKQSDAYKVLTAVEQAMYAIRFAMQAQAMIKDLFFTTSTVTNAATRASADGVAAVAKTASSVPFPYNLIAMGVVAAALVAMGVKMAGGGGGGASGASAEEVQKTQGTGTVLGDSGAKSDSLLQAIKEIEKADKLGLVLTHEMLRALQAIQNSMAALATAIYQQTGLTQGRGFEQVEPGSSVNIQADLGTHITSQLDPLFGKLWDWLNTTKVTITDTGIMIQGTVAQLMQGQGLSSYANVHTEPGWVSSLFGGSSSDEIVPGGLDASVTNQFKLLFRQIVDAVKSAAEALGVWSPLMAAKIENFVVDIGKISLDGLKGQELQDALNAVFSKFADQISMEAFSFPDFGYLMKAGEGFFQTMIRLAVEFQVVTQTLDVLGLRMNATGSYAIQLSDNLIQLAGGVEDFSKLTSDYFSQYFTAPEQHTNLGNQLGTEFAALGVAMPTTTAGFRALVQSLDMTKFADQELFVSLMKLAPSFYEFADSFVGLDGALHTHNEALAQSVTYQEQIDVANGTFTQREIDNMHRRNAAMTPVNLAMVNAAIAAEDAAIAQDRANQTRDIEIQLMDAQGLHTEALAARRALEIQGMTEAQVALYDYEQSLKDQIDAAKRAKEVADESVTWQERLNIAQGLTTQQQVEREHQWAAALDDGTRALMTQTWAQEDANEAETKRAEESLTWEEKLNIARGLTTQQQIDRERQWAAALDDGTRAAMTAVWAIEDQAAANRDLAEAAKAAQADQSSLWNQFASDQMKVEAATASLTDGFGALGIAIPTTRTQFADLVASIDATTPAGQAMLEMLKSLAPAWLLVNQAMDEFLQQQQTIAQQVATTWAAATAAAQAAAQAAAAAAAQAAIDKLDLLARIYALTGNAAGAAAVLEQQHQLALAKLHPSLRALQTQLWELEAAAAAAAKAAELASARRDLEIQLQEALGNDEIATAMRRADILAGLDESLRGLQQQVWDALDARALEQKASEWSKTLNDWLNGVALNSNLSPLTAQQQLSEARRQYDLALAGGDAGALTQAADALLAADKAVEGFGGGYSALYASIREQIAQAAAREALPTAGESAISNNIVELHKDTNQRLDAIARLMERRMDQAADQSDDVTGAVTNGLDRQSTDTRQVVNLHARR